MNRLAHVSLFPLLGLGLATALTAQEHDLRVQAKKGATVWLSQQSQMEMTMDMGGQPAEMGGSTTTITQVTVQEVDAEGVLTVETKVHRIHGAMTVPMAGEIEFDSADAGDDAGANPMAMMTKALTALAGKSYGAKVSPHGKVLSLVGADDLLKNARRGGAMMGNSVSETQLRSMVETAFGFVPEKPTAVGGSWEHVQKEDANTPAVKLTLTLAKVDADAFDVTAVGTTAEQDQGEGRTLKMTGSQRVSRADGFLMEAKQAMTMVGSQKGPMGDMDVDMKVTLTTRRTTADAAMPAKKTAAPADAPK